VTDADFKLSLRLYMAKSSPARLSFSKNELTSNWQKLVCFTLNLNPELN